MTGDGRLAVSLDVSAIPADPRGAGRYVVELVTALARRQQVDLHLLARRDDGDRWQQRAPSARVHAAVPRPRPLRLLWEQAAAHRTIDRWPVAVHHGPHYTMPERSRLPAVVTIHDLTFFDHPEWHEPAKVRFFQRAIQRAAERAAALVCVSDATARRVQELLAPAVPVHAIPHGVDHHRFRPAPDDGDGRRRSAAGARPPYVLFVGTLEPRKNVAALVGAFDAIADRYPDLQLVLAGGRGWGAATLEAAIDASPHRTRIVRPGYIDDDTVASLLRGAAAVAYPALVEGFGLPALEALACGTPLVTTAGSVMDEVAEGAALTVPAGDAGALAAALDAAVAAPDEARRQHGLAVAARYTWDATAAAHERVYAAAAGATA